MTAPPFLESRFPVGSSANRIAGLPTNARATLLTARELSGVVVHPVGHADPLQGLLHALAPLGPFQVAVGQRQLHVFEDLEIADEVEVLEDESYLPVSQVGPLSEREARNRVSVEVVFPGRGSVQQSHDGEQCGFAAARRASNGDVITLPHAQVNPGQGMGLHLLRQEDLGDPVHLNQPFAVSIHRFVSLV